MTPDFVPEMIPLGPRLEAAARALSLSKQQLPAWFALLHAVSNRAARMLPRSDRFVRVEATGVPGIEKQVSLEPALDTGQALPAEIRNRLRPMVGPAADRLRVHEGEQAQRVANAHRADAVSLGADVYFARGRYRPHDARGFALLAHEVMHVEQATRPDVSWRRTSAAALEAEEAAAHSVEHYALWGAQARSRSPLAPTPVAAAPVVAASQVVSAAQQPMAAAAERSLDAPSAVAPVNVEALRQVLMRDLMNQIRADLERGG